MKYGTHLAVVGGRGASLWIDGIARRAAFSDGGSVTRIAAPRPGTLVFEQGFHERLRFEAGERVPVGLDMFLSDNPVRQALGKITTDGSDGWFEGWTFTEGAIDSLLRKMRETEAGAILSFLPNPPSKLQLAAVRYRRTDPDLLWNAVQDDRSKSIAAVLAKPDEGEKIRAEAESAAARLHAAIEDIAQLSAVDGAVLAGPRLAIYGSGYVIPGSPQKPRARLVRNREGSDFGDLHPHGARHSAAINFADDNPGGVAFVVSEDGPVKCALRVADDVLVWPVRIGET